MFHDVRFASDMLSNKFDIELANVTDTMAWHSVLMTWALYAGYVPKYAISCSRLVRAYFGVTGANIKLLSIFRSMFSTWRGGVRQTSNIKRQTSNMLYGILTKLVVIMNRQPFCRVGLVLSTLSPVAFSRRHEDMVETAVTSWLGNRRGKKRYVSPGPIPGH